jgi:hypothetical protein
MHDYDFNLKFIGPDLHKQLELETKYDKHAQDLAHFECRDDITMRRLMATKDYGAWYMKPDDFEKTLLQGYLNKLEGLLKPGEKRVDFAKP